MEHKPIARNKSLQPLSRDHHNGLLLCWKIRTGLKKNIDINRIKSYTDWFYQEHLKPHFEIEEQIVFPVLGLNHELIKKALDDHRLLAGLFMQVNDIYDTLVQIESELNKHIRFEERVLFNEIEKIASEEQLLSISEAHNDDPISSDWPDEFWK